MRDYLRAVGAQEHIRLAHQVTLKQLGTAKGGVINPGVSVELATLAFLLVFLASAATTLWLARVRQGWNTEAAPHTQVRAST
jgi:hypothetical protein